MCGKKSIRKIFIFSATFLIGVFAVASYQLSNSTIKTQNLLSDESPVVAERQSQKLANESKETGFSGSGESSSNQKSECLDYCRVCKCATTLSDLHQKVLENETTTNSKPLEIKYKPKPKYTEEARNNNIQGNVRVRVTFLANGEIGLVSEVAGLPYGLSERAIEAAKKIKFKPQTSNGKPITVTRVVNYNFTIY